MANAMLIAIGAGFLHPNRQIIAFCGDVGITMILDDLMNISQYKILVKIVMFKNRCVGMVQLEMRLEDYMDWKTDMLNQDFVKIPESVNIAAWEAKQTRDVAQALQNGVNHNGLAIIDIFTDTNALAVPPTIKRAQVIRTANFIGKLMINYKTAEIIVTSKSDLKYLKEFF